MMIKYELCTDHIEVPTKAWTTWSEQKVLDKYAQQITTEPHLVTAADTLKELEADFEREKMNCRAYTFRTSAGLYLHADLVYVEVSEYDDDGDFVQACEWANVYAAAYQPEEVN